MPKYKRKFVKKISYVDPILGRTSYHLINLTSGEEILPVADFLRSRIQLTNSGKNSVGSWIDDLSSFFDYYVASTEYISKNHSSISTTVLADIIFAYPTYLISGRSALNNIASNVAKMTGAQPLAKKSAQRRLSTLKSFLTSSTIIQENLIPMKKLGLINVDISGEVFFEKLLKRKRINIKQRNHLLHKSMLAGVISGGPKYVSSNTFILPKSSQSTSSWVEKAFPCQQLIELIQNANTYRDRALWALLAGTGIRTHEALNLLQKDIDGVNETVSILPYHDRITEYKHTKLKDIESLSSKGRSTKETFFIEPFKTIFFDNLQLYLSHERPICNHNVVFVSLSNNSRGRPSYLGDAKGHNKPFKKAQHDMPFLKAYTLHSLRHFFATWVLNYLPTEHGYGLNIETVRLMMGHASSSTTERYAVRDKLLIRAQLKAFNNYFKKNGFNLHQIKSAALKHTIDIASL